MVGRAQASVTTTALSVKATRRAPRMTPRGVGAAGSAVVSRVVEMAATLPVTGADQP
jgi:hypothetical protein